jgi:hypothetical protein
MGRSLNARIVVASPDRSLTRLLRSAAHAHDWYAERPDSLDDEEISFDCHRHGAAVEVSLAELGDGDMLLRLAPNRDPGLLERLVYRVEPTAGAADLRELAMAFHEALSRRYNQLVWCEGDVPDAWNGAPDPNST